MATHRSNPTLAAILGLGLMTDCSCSDPVPTPGTETDSSTASSTTAGADTTGGGPDGTASTASSGSSSTADTTAGVTASTTAEASSSTTGTEPTDGSGSSTGTTGGGEPACHCFGSSTTFAVVDDAQNVEVADLDGDGDLDLAIAGKSANAIELHLNDGTGAFTPSSVPVVWPRAVRAGDVDGDLDVDLVILDGNGIATATLSILENDGAGNFVDAGASVLAPYDTGELAIGDLDGDGDLDAVAGVTSYDDPMLLIYLNDGAGTFAPAQELVGDYDPWDLQIVDADGEGSADIVASVGGNTIVAFGDGTGTFTPARVSGYGAPAAWGGSTRFADLDGDAHPDAVMMGREVSWLRRGLGTGTGIDTALALAEPLRTDQGVELELVDLDANGTLDLLTTMAGDVAFALGDGSGGFSPFATAAGGTAADVSDLAVGDLDGDGVLDVVTLTPSTDEAVVFFGVADPMAGACDSVCGLGACGDGQVDLLTEECDGATDCIGCAWGPAPECGDRVVTPGSMCYAPPIFRWAFNDWELYGIDGADLDGDGRLDLTVGLRDSDQVYEDLYWGVYWDFGEGVYQWSGEYGLLSASPSWVCRGIPQVSVGQLDPNVDSFPDFSINCAIDSLTSYTIKGFGDGLGGFVGMAEVHPNMWNPEHSTLGDFDGDADDDVLSAAGILGSEIALNNGSGSFSAPVGTAPGSLFGRRVLTGDLTGDGDLDAIVLGPSIVVRPGNGLGGLAPSYTVMENLSEATVVDVDGDGDLDLVGAEWFGGNELYTLLNDGTGMLTTQGPYGPWNGIAWSVDALEADGDGSPDIVVAHSMGITLLHGNGDGTFGPGQLLFDGLGVRDTFVLDVDGDGLDDIFATRTLNAQTLGNLLFFRSDP